MTPSARRWWIYGVLAALIAVGGLWFLLRDPLAFRAGFRWSDGVRCDGRATLVWRDDTTLRVLGQERVSIHDGEAWAHWPEIPEGETVSLYVRATDFELDRGLANSTGWTYPRWGHPDLLRFGVYPREKEHSGYTADLIWAKVLVGRLRTGGPRELDDEERERALGLFRGLDLEAAMGADPERVCAALALAGHLNRRTRVTIDSALFPHAMEVCAPEARYPLMRARAFLAHADFRYTTELDAFVWGPLGRSEDPVVRRWFDWAVRRTTSSALRWNGEIHWQSFLEAFDRPGRREQTLLDIRLRGELLTEAQRRDLAQLYRQGLGTRQISPPLDLAWVALPSAIHGLQFELAHFLFRSEVDLVGLEERVAEALRRDRALALAIGPFATWDSLSAVLGSTRPLRELVDVYFESIDPTAMRLVEAAALSGLPECLERLEPGLANLGR